MRKSHYFMGNKFLAFTFAALLILPCKANAQIHWAHANPQFFDVQLIGTNLIAYGSETSYRSWTLTNWAALENSEGLTIRKALQRPDGVLGVGFGIFFSNDGEHWEKIAESPRLLADVVAGDQGLVAVGQGGTILTSKSGETWSQETSGGAQSLNSIACHEGKYVAVGAGGTILVSLDGGKWSSVNSGTTVQFNTVEWIVDRWFILGNSGAILASTNATQWTQFNVEGAEGLFGLDFSRGVFVLSGLHGKIWRSVDGVNWLPQNSQTTHHLFKVIFTLGRFIIAGSQGTILSSADGLSWNRLRGSAYFPDRNLRDAAFGNGRFVAVGDNLKITSTNGFDWQATDDNSRSDSVAFGNDRFVAVGPNGYCAVSLDGLSWTITTPDELPTTPLGRKPEFSTIAYGGGKFVAAGWHGALMSSPDGFNWTIVPPLTNQVHLDIAFGNNLFVLTTTRLLRGQNQSALNSAASPATGPNTNITFLISSDTLNWTSLVVPDAGDYSFYSVAYGNGIFTAHSGDVTAALSKDGVSWTVYTNHWLGSKIRFFEDTFVAPDAWLSTSTDGIHWTMRQRVSGFLPGVAEGNGIFVAVGQGGRIFTSARELNLEIRRTMPSVGNEIVVTGSSGRDFVVERSENLKDWTAWKQVPGSPNLYQTMDFDSASQRFYRARALGQGP